MLGVLLAMSLAAAPMPEVESGVSETLARERAAAIRDLRYELSFVVPAPRSERVQGRVVIRFTLAAPHRVVLDFAQPPASVRACTRVVARSRRPGRTDI
jgi:aminopeptidase N